MSDSSLPNSGKIPAALLAAGVASVIGSRLAQANLVWIEEAYGMAAAAEIFRGKQLYSEIWFDKPPLYAWFYTLSGAIHLRLLGAAFVLFCAWCVYLAGRRLWDGPTGILAAGLLCFGLTFWFPASIMATAPDLLMIAPHVLSIWGIASGKPLVAGAFAGVALWCNPKALFLVPVLLLWDLRRSARTMAGFVAVGAAGLVLIPVGDYWTQVWWWGSRYSADTFVEVPVREFLARTSGWAAFHATAVFGTVVYLWRTRDWRVAVWAGLSLAGVVAGLRFFPRYYFQLLPVVALAGARGWMLVSRPWQIALAALLLVPVVRFGPRYVQGVEGWSDAAMMQDSREASRLIGAGSLVVWGYRPDIYVFSGNPAGSKFLDSQPLTGVLADRHLVDSKPTFPELAVENREALSRTEPEFIVDGLGLLNPDLGIGRYPDLQNWLADYDEVGRTGMSIVLRRRRDKQPAH